LLTSFGFCTVPGQDKIEWFYGLTAFLFLFGMTCFFIAKKVYKLV